MDTAAEQEGSTGADRTEQSREDFLEAEGEGNEERGAGKSVVGIKPLEESKI